MNSFRCSPDTTHVLSFLSVISDEPNFCNSRQEKETAQKNLYGRYDKYSNVRIGGRGSIVNTLNCPENMHIVLPSLLFIYTSKQSDFMWRKSCLSQTTKKWNKVKHRLVLLVNCQRLVLTHNSMDEMERGSSEGHWTFRHLLALQVFHHSFWDVNGMLK